MSSPPMAAHPGEVLSEMLREKGMSQAEFARRMGVSQKHVSEIVKGKAGYSPSFAVKLERVFGGKPPAAYWINLLSNHELELARQRASADG